MYQILLKCFVLAFMLIGCSLSTFMLYTTVRDDRRREKERKENPDKKYYY